MESFIKLLISLANFPLPFFRKLIPSLPNEIKSFNTVQRLWFVVSVLTFYSSISMFLAFIIISTFDNVDFGLVILSVFFCIFLPIVLYHAVSILSALLSALFGFIFEKNLDTIKKRSSNAVKGIDSQTILRYLLILLVIVVISAVLIGMF
tara:strand:+ start:96 stop:545 length:450 start_codon:yes stop_codon:yes gene_type:complete